MLISHKTPKSNKVILVTGATGFIGRQAIEPLVNKGYQVHILTSKKAVPSVEQVASFFMLSLEQVSNVKFHFCDLLDFSNLNLQLSSILSSIKPSHLLHLAWYVKHGEFWNSTINLEWVSASLRLAELFEKHGGSRIVMAGTCAEYDWSQIPSNKSITDLAKGLAESFPVGPSTLYGECKLSQFNILQKFSQNMQMELAWGRIFLTYGPHEGASRLIPYIIQTLLKNQIAQLKVNWHQVRDFIHVKDLASGFVHLVDHDSAGVFNIASGQALTLAQIFLQITKQMKVSAIDTNIDIAKLNDYEATAENLINESKSFSKVQSDVLYADVQKITKTGWCPQITLEQGLTEAIHYWKEKIKYES